MQLLEIIGAGRPAPIAATRLHEEEISATALLKGKIYDACSGVVMKGHFPCGWREWQIALCEYRSFFYQTKHYERLRNLTSIKLYYYDAQLPENLILLNGLVIFLEFFAIKTFPTKLLRLGRFPCGKQIMIEINFLPNNFPSSNLGYASRLSESLIVLLHGAVIFL